MHRDPIEQIEVRLNKWLKWAGYALLALIVACIPLYWWLFAETHRAPAGGYAIDIAEVRRLADTQPGEKPLLLRLETAAHVSPPKAFVVAGDSWQGIDLPLSSYEVVYRDHIAVLDTALNADVAKSMGATRFDSAAYADERRAGACQLNRRDA